MAADGHKIKRFKMNNEVAIVWLVIIAIIFSVSATLMIFTLIEDLIMKRQAKKENIFNK